MELIGIVVDLELRWISEQSTLRMCCVGFVSSTTVSLKTHPLYACLRWAQLRFQVSRTLSRTSSLQVPCSSWTVLRAVASSTSSTSSKKSARITHGNLLSLVAIVLLTFDLFLN
mmetsp:Transcript_23565/g.27661  ORF Transcript_23565/g.27661 Transcript_23565/m.27661 type:complete len:114 (-) Transcript_23565:28-369(-)